MQDSSFNRRHWLASAALGAVAATTAGCATPAADKANPAQAGVPPTEWTDRHGLVAALPKDKDPLTNELDKYPRCRYCGMERAKFSHTRHLLVYEDDSVEGTCSLHCAAISLSLNMDRGPKAHVTPVTPAHLARSSRWRRWTKCTMCWTPASPAP
jgi:copper chaperone NosL